MQELAGIRELLNVELPAELDVLVQQRMQLAWRTSAEAAHAPITRSPSLPTEALPTSIEVPASPALTLPRAERWIYALGLFAYGTQALSGALRLLWHSVAG
jgi:hypothetical protein